MLTVLSLDHARSTVAQREPFALPTAERARLSRLVRRACGCQVAFLVTCNRVELILWGNHAEARSLIGGLLAVGRRLAPEIAERFVAAATHYHGDDAARHLLRVAAGLASQVEGDVQVLGQVRSAYAEAAESGSVGPELHRIFQTALRAGKRVHHETEFGRRKASLGTAAAEKLAQRLGLAAPASDDRRADVVLLGAGKAAEAAGRALLTLGVRLTIVNRDRERAEGFAREVGAVVAPFEDRHAAVAGADAAILATGAQEPILVAEALQEARVSAGPRPRPLLLIDLGFPRNVDPASAALDGVTLMGVQDLAGNGAAECAGVSERRAAEAIVEQEAQVIRSWLASRTTQFVGAA